MSNCVHCMTKTFGVNKDKVVSRTLVGRHQGALSTHRSFSRFNDAPIGLMMEDSALRLFPLQRWFSRRQLQARKRNCQSRDLLFGRRPEGKRMAIDTGSCKQNRCPSFVYMYFGRFSVSYVKKNWNQPHVLVSMQWHCIDISLLAWHHPPRIHDILRQKKQRKERRKNERKQHEKKKERTERGNERWKA